MKPIDVIASPRRCARCQTEFLPHEGGQCPQCARPLCRSHGGAAGSAARCPACERAAQLAAVGGGKAVLPKAA